uniref:Band 7 domain-containing protein n=1 Tax=Timema monikensis TaxID=170555 RepID=A0A7R9DZK4_9NEOP|nr:unnamed protein product [Timema monikensis]
MAHTCWGPPLCPGNSQETFPEENTKCEVDTRSRPMRGTQVYRHLRGGKVKTNLIASDRDSNLTLPDIGSLVYCGSSALDHAAEFAWKEGRKPFREEKHPQYTQLGSNHDLPIIGSPVYCESSALDYSSTEVRGSTPPADGSLILPPTPSPTSSPLMSVAPSYPSTPPSDITESEEIWPWRVGSKARVTPERTVVNETRFIDTDTKNERRRTAFSRLRACCVYRAGCHTPSRYAPPICKSDMGTLAHCHAALRTHGSESDQVLFSSCSRLVSKNAGVAAVSGRSGVWRRVGNPTGLQDIVRDASKVVDIISITIVITRQKDEMTWGFVTCGPNEALVVSGCCYNKPLLVPGGRAFVISLNTMTLQVESPTVYTSQGVPISVTGIAQVKIQGQNEEMLLAACEQFLGKSETEIQHIALVTLEGHQRAIMGSMTVEEIYKDRKKFSKQVFEVASSDLVNMGITVVSYTLKDIRDEEGYLKSLGMARTAEVKRDARIGEAEARKDAQIKEAIAEEERMASRFLNDTEIAKAQRDFELKKAAYDVEVQTKKAEAEFAYELQAAKTKQRIKEEQMQILVVERTQEILVQDQEIQRKERELEATVRRPAEAEKFRLEKLAEANGNRVILEAEAEAESLRVRGEAEAFAIEAKARAEAEQMIKKAEAWKEYKDAAMIDMLLDTLPKIAAEVAAPLSQAKKITMVSSGQGEVGASKLTGEVLSIMIKVPEVVKSLTGVDLVKVSIIPSTPHEAIKYTPLFKNLFLKLSMESLYT